MRAALALPLAARNVVSLCDRTGNWARPYAEAGARVVTVDVQPAPEGSLYPGRTHLVVDVRLVTPAALGRADVVLCQPPCTKFASSGARWHRTDDEMREALALVDACLRHVRALAPRTWALENPVGKLSRWLGPPRLRFDPCDYGDAYTKRTCIWGDFVPPLKRPVAPTEGSKMHRLPPGPERANLRSVTPMGWARAFQEANP